MGSLLILIDFGQETVASILKFDHFVWLESLHVALVTRLLHGVVALIHHVGVVDARGPNHFNLVVLLLLLEHFCGTVLVTKQHFNLVLLPLLKLSKLLLLWLNKDFLEDKLVLLLALRRKCLVGPL